MATPPRPLSPHLQIYRPQLTSTLSVLHRASGMVLAFGTLFLTLWLASAANGGDTFEAVQAFLGSILGRLILFGFTAALFYHLCNGIRHLAWDLGIGYSLPVLYRSGYVVLISAGVLTLLTWVLAYALMPA